jgi:uncharacterized lipoprotein YddW (UPF0748 family)
MRHRPPLKLVLLLAAVLLVVAVLGVGLFKAATYHEPSPSAAKSGPPAIGPATGEIGRCGSAPATAPRQLRGMWLTTVLNLDFPAKPGESEAQVKAEYEKWLDLAVAQHHNAIFVHVRPSGDAFWPSDYAPWSEWLTGKRDGRSPGWDPMAFMVSEAHARNLEFHAWFNPFRGSQPAPEGPGASFAKLAPTNPLLKHKDWAISYPPGDSERARFYYDPGNPAARKYVEDSILEAVRKYDIDGVHFDDFFYPYPEDGKDFPDNASYAKWGGGKSRGDWRRSNIDTFMRELDQRIKQLKPWVKFGVSPFGIWRNRSSDPAGSPTDGLESYDANYADTRTWVKEGWIDYIVPQLYWQIGFAKADYAKLLPWWADVVKGTDVQLYIGEADYRVGEPGAWSDPAQLDKQMTLDGKYPAVQGQVHYSASQVRDNKLGAVAKYRNDHYATPALVPVMKQLPAAPPGAPELVAAQRGAHGEVDLTAKTGTGVAATSWALYRVDGAAAKLVATGRAGSQVADPAPPKGGDATYCLSGLDRSGNEGPLSPPFTTQAG